MKKSIIYLFLFFLFSQYSKGQVNGELLRISNTVYENGWIEYKQGSNINGATLFNVHKSKFRLGEDDEMQLVQSNEDDFDFIHYRYQQYYDGVKVEGAQYFVHQKDGYALKSNGKLVIGLDINTTPTLTEQQAIDSALNILPSPYYNWQDSIKEAFIKVKTGDNNATYYPEPELVVTNLIDSLNLDSNNAVLAYKMNVISDSSDINYVIYINANTGSEIRRFSLIHSCVQGQASTIYNGTQNINTDQLSTNDFRLFDDCRGDGIQTLTGGSMGGFKTEGTNEVLNTSNTWPSSLGMYTQAHWGAQMTYDYYLNVHNRNSYDGNGAIMVQRLGSDATNCFNNAGWKDFERETVFCGGFDGNNWYVSLDVIGHEWTHGIAKFTADFFPTKEPGALNESFADIFGNMIEFYAEGLDENHQMTSSDYDIGEDYYFIGAGPPNRSMSNPPSSPSQTAPDTYGVLNWFTTENSNSYYKMGVQSKWFYLLAEGGQGVNDHSVSYDVTGIGKEKAAQIAYRNLTVYLMKYSMYADARQGSIEAARDLFGDCSDEVLQTIEAWNAVGVYAPSIQTNKDVCGTIINSTTTPSNSSPNIFIASNSIAAPGASCSPAQNIIDANASAVFKAGNSINLKPGFHAKSGSDFHAYIFSCAGGSNKLASHTRHYSGETITSSKVLLNEDDVKNLFVSIAPNPFTQNTEIKYFLKQNKVVDIIVYDLYGNVVNVLISKSYNNSGEHAVVLQKGELASGLYYCHIITDNEKSIQKIIIL